MTPRRSLLELADEGVEVAAIGALALLALETSADPSMVAGLISGLGGYRMHRRTGAASSSSSSEIPTDPPGGSQGSAEAETQA